MQVLYCAGPAIDALVTTGAHHYLEFKLISGQRLPLGSLHLIKMPESKEQMITSATASRLVHLHFGVVICHLCNCIAPLHRICVCLVLAKA